MYIYVNVCIYVYVFIYTYFFNIKWLNIFTRLYIFGYMWVRTVIINSNCRPSFVFFYLNFQGSWGHSKWYCVGAENGWKWRGDKSSTLSSTPSGRAESSQLACFSLKCLWRRPRTETPRKGRQVHPLNGDAVGPWCPPLHHCTDNSKVKKPEPDCPD